MLEYVMINLVLRLVATLALVACPGCGEKAGSERRPSPRRVPPLTTAQAEVIESVLLVENRPIDAMADADLMMEVGLLSQRFKDRLKPYMTRSSAGTVSQEEEDLIKHLTSSHDERHRAIWLEIERRAEADPRNWWSLDGVDRTRAKSN